METTNSNSICTVNTQETSYIFPVKVQTLDDYLIILFSTNELMTLTEDLAIDFSEISITRIEYQDIAHNVVDSKEVFNFTTSLLPEFGNTQSAIGTVVYDTTINNRVI
jgi:hypothetical protein